MSLTTLQGGSTFKWDWYKTRSIGENRNTNSITDGTVWTFSDNTQAKYVNKFAAWQLSLPNTTSVVYDFNASGSNTDIVDFHGDVQTFTGVKELIITHESGTATVAVTIAGDFARWLVNNTDVVPELEETPPVFIFHLRPGGSLHILCPDVTGYLTSTNSTITFANTTSGATTVNIGVAGKG